MNLIYNTEPLTMDLVLANRLLVMPGCVPGYQGSFQWLTQSGRKLMAYFSINAHLRSEPH